MENRIEHSCEFVSIRGYNWPDCLGGGPIVKTKLDARELFWLDLVTIDFHFT
jgi:hypothetical protein